MHALQIDAADAQNWHLMAKILIDHAESNGAYDALMHAVSIDPASAETWQTVGQLYLSRGQPADAVVAYEHAVHLHPGSPAWFDVGVARHYVLTADGAHVDAANITAAVEAYTKALSICSSKREDICARLQHLQTLQALNGGRATPVALPGENGGGGSSGEATATTPPAVLTGAAPAGQMAAGIGGSSGEPLPAMSSSMFSAATGPGLAQSLGTRLVPPPTSEAAAMTPEAGAAGLDGARGVDITDDANGHAGGPLGEEEDEEDEEDEEYVGDDNDEDEDEDEGEAPGGEGADAAAMAMKAESAGTPPADLIPEAPTDA